MTKKKAKVEKYTGITMQQTLPNNREEWLMKAIFLTKRAIGNDKTTDFLSVQLERLLNELKTIQKKK